MAVTKERILAEIRRTALQNDGRPLGIARFFAETGVKQSDWRGIFWARWGDAVTEAGYPPNQLNPARSDDDLLTRLASLVQELGHFPVVSELKLKTRRDADFPNPKTLLHRFGNKS